ncbi:hypothetical protein Tco_1450451 [Tanacetum coccineum]
MYYPRFTKVIIHYFLTKDKTVSWRNKIVMHTSRDDCLINTLKFVSANEVSQIYGARLPESITSPEMRETKAYKTYLGYAIGATPPKITRKFKKASPSKKDINLNLVPVDEEPKFAKKKKKEKVFVNKGKGIELLSEVALTEESQMKEVHKSTRDFHRTHLSSSGKLKKNQLKVKLNLGERIKMIAIMIMSSEGSDQENDSGDDNTQSDNEKGSDSEQEMDENESESKVDDNAEGDEDKGMDDTTNLLYDDVDVRLNDSVHADEEFVQKEGTNAKMINVQRRNENMEITLDQVIEDAHVTISTVAKKIEVRVTSSSLSSDLASKS